MSLVEGKTKRVVATETPFVVALEAIDRLTGGDAAKVAEIEDIGAQKTRQTANVFSLLKSKGVPTAFIEQDGAKRLLCRHCNMLPLEFVVRRYAFGSYLKRVDLASGHRFEAPTFELFHKDSLVMPPLVDAPAQMTEDQARSQYLIDGTWKAGVYTDPYIDFSDAQTWGIYSAKSPIEGAPLSTCAAVLTPEQIATAAETIVKPTFLHLEEAWAKVSTVHGPVSLVDMKVELGLDAETGELLLSDVIDNDSWRLWPGGEPGHQLDKQAFRDGEDLAKISEKYALVTELTEGFAS